MNIELLENLIEEGHFSIIINEVDYYHKNSK